MELECGDGLDNDCDGLTDAMDADCSGFVCPFTCGDINGSGGNVDLADFATLAVCFGLASPSPACNGNAFFCSDLDANGAINLVDFGTIAVLFGQNSTQSPPECL